MPHTSPYIAHSVSIAAYQGRLTFLGTGTSMGVPVVACDCEVCTSVDVRNNRLRSSVLIQVNGKHLLIDCGPDFRQQMLRANVKHLDAILLTHAHYDHMSGLDDVRAFNWQVQGAMPIYAEHSVHQDMKTRFDYAFQTYKYPGVPEYSLVEIGEKPFQCMGVDVMPLRVWHHRLPVLGFRVGKMAYVTDVNRIDEPELQKLMGLDVLVISGLRFETHISHFSLPEALDVIARVAPRRAFITHIGHQLGLHGTVEPQLPDHVRLAYDGLEIDFVL